jgi:hypothetical protein
LRLLWSDAFDAARCRRKCEACIADLHALLAKSGHEIGCLQSGNLIQYAAIRRSRDGELMEKIQILIYTDYMRINEDPDPGLKKWSITELKKLISYKTRDVVEVNVDLINRHANGSKASNKLTRKLLCQYDELWVFGYYSTKEPPWGLSNEEAAALAEWMDAGGGVLVTGDHSGGQCSTDHDRLPNLGRSLGHRIKRAGQLRVWEGPPTSCTDGELSRRDNFNTLSGTEPDTLDAQATALQSDHSAQTLLQGSSPPHRLFWGSISDSGATPISVFPDHGHEGRVILPEALNDEWPQGSPRPEIAAEGTDNRFPAEARRYILVAAFDGDPVKVGRIVADSSFHHYLNVNLRLIPHRGADGYPSPESALDQIAQYYGNLAVWLAPRAIRDKIQFDIFYRLAAHPDVFEIMGSGVERLGAAAQYVLNLEIGPDNLYRLFDRSESEKAWGRVDEFLAAVLIRRNSFVEMSLEQQRTVLGSIVEAHHRLIVPDEIPSLEWLDEKPSPLAMIGDGLQIAAEIDPGLVERLLPQFLSAVEEFQRNEVT